MFINYLGFTGMALILFAFIMDQMNKWKNDDISYDLCNAVGAVLMVIYAYAISAYPFLFLNSVWAFVSIKDVITDLRKKKKKRK